MKPSVRLSDDLKAVRRTAVVVLLPVLLLALATVGAHANIGLYSFSGTPGDGHIVLNWETATEFDNAGFFIQRGNQIDGPFTRISGFILAGDSVTGGSYGFTDEQVTNGVAYYYILEDISYSQVSSTHGPITVTAGLATVTPTPTSPPPVGAPPTSRPPRPTETPTPTSTSTPIPGQTTTLPEAQGGPAPAPLSSGMTPLATATATTATLAASRVTVTSVPSGIFASPQATSLPASSSNPVSRVTSTPRAAVQPTQASTAISELKPTSTPVSIAGQGTPSDTFPGAIKSTDWAVVGLAFGLFAASLILILGAILVVRLLLSR